MRGNIPRLVTGKRGIAYQPVGAVGLGCGNLVVERGKRDIVAHAPFGCPLLFHRVVLHPAELVEPDGHQITAHIGKVNVAAIDIAGVVTFFQQRLGNAGQEACLGRHLHQRRTGKRRIAAPCAERAAVGAIGIGIEIREIHALVHQFVETGHDVLTSADILRKDASAAFQQYYDNVGTVDAQKRVGLFAHRWEDVAHQRCPLGFLHKMVFGNVAGRLLQRREEREHGIHGRMVEKLVLREISLSDIGGRFVYSAPDADDDNGQQQQVEERAQQLLRSRTQPEFGITFINNEGNQQPYDKAHNHIAGRNAGHGLGGRRKILQARGIELESPEGIKTGVGHEGQRQGYGNKGKPDAHHPAQNASRPWQIANPQTHDCNQNGYSQDIKGRGKIERETVGDDRPHISRRKGMAIMVKKHEEAFGHQKHQNCPAKDLQQICQPTFHDYF